MTIQIPLRGRRGAGRHAIIDADKAHIVQGRTWRINKLGYVYTHITISSKKGRRRVKISKLHRLIMDAQPGQLVDHKNRDKLDCRTDNLRFCTHAQSNYNTGRRPGTSRYKGVYYCRPRNRWVAQIKHQGQHMNLGRFKSEVEAAKAYDAKAREFFQEFAVLNNPQDAA